MFQSNISYKKNLLIVIIAVLIIPFPTTIVPAWKLKVIDDKGKICPKKEVTQTWAHYSVCVGLGCFQSEDKITNAEGNVEFPKRTIWAPLIWRILGSLIANALTIAHGSAGVASSVHTRGLKDVAWLSYKPNEQLPKKMIVESCKLD